MQAKFSKGFDCQRFPQATGANLPAPASNLREASIMRAWVEMFKIGLTTMIKQNDHVRIWYDYGDTYSP